MRLVFVFIVFAGIEAEDAQHDDAYIPDTTGSDIHTVKLAIIHLTMRLPAVENGYHD